MRSHKYDTGGRGGFGGSVAFLLVLEIKTYICTFVYVFVVKVYLESVCVYTRLNNVSEKFMLLCSVQLQTR